MVSMFRKEVYSTEGKNSYAKRVIYLFLLGLSIRMVWAWLPEQYLFYLVSDDAYYYFTIARNLVSRGMLSTDGIMPTNGFHPLWLFLITPIFLFFKTHHWLCIHFTLTLTAIFDTAAAFLIYRCLEKLGKPQLGFWAAAFYLANPYGLWNSMNGLETGLNNFFLAGFLYFSAAGKSEGLEKEWLTYGTFSGLAMLSRTDNIFAVAVFLMFLLRQNRNFIAVVKIAGVAALVIAPWLVYNFATFGTLVQSSGTAYPFLNHAQYLTEHKSFFSLALIPYLIRLSFSEFVLNAFHYGLWHLTALVGVFLAFRLKGWPKETRPVLWGLAAAGLFAIFHLFIRWSVRPWYAQAVFVLTLPAIALSFEKTNRYLVVLGAAAALFLAGWRVQAEPFRLAERSYVILDVVNNIIPPNERVGVFNSGFVQYFTDRKVVNLDGLVNNEVLAFYREKRGLEYLRTRNIGWVVDRSVYIAKIFGPYWGSGAQGAFILTDIAPDISFPGNTVFIVQYLGDSPRPLYGKRLEIDSLPPPKSWIKIPLYPKF